MSDNTIKPTWKATKEKLVKDASRNGFKLNFLSFLLNDFARFFITLRFIEYVFNRNLFLYRVLNFFFFIPISKKLSFSIPPFTTGGGLRLPHYGTIVINSKARLGECCQVNVGVVIGSDLKNADKAPRLGCNVFIGVGAKIIGDITIGNNVSIGANSVVVKSFTDENISLVGVPARKIVKNV